MYIGSIYFSWLYVACKSRYCLWNKLCVQCSDISSTRRVRDNAPIELLCGISVLRIRWNPKMSRLVNTLHSKTISQNIASGSLSALISLKLGGFLAMYPTSQFQEFPTSKLAETLESSVQSIGYIDEKSLKSSITSGRNFLLSAMVSLKLGAFLAMHSSSSFPEFPTSQLAGTLEVTGRSIRYLYVLQTYAGARTSTHKIAVPVLHRAK